MTRINVGIHPRDLCDQHLIAEACKELPRVYRHRDTASIPSFRLGTGHVLWCAQHLGSILRRHIALERELRHRGFHEAAQGVRRIILSQAQRCLHAPRWSDMDECAARHLLQDRIKKRLCDMHKGEPRRRPRWTRRDPPAWARDVISMTRRPLPSHPGADIRPHLRAERQERRWRHFLRTVTSRYSREDILWALDEVERQSRAETERIARSVM